MSANVILSSKQKDCIDFCKGLLLDWIVISYVFSQDQVLFIFNSIVIYLFLGAAALYHFINQPTCSQTSGMHRESSEEAHSQPHPLLVGPGIAGTGLGRGGGLGHGSSLWLHTSPIRSQWEREKESSFMALPAPPVLSRQKNGA